MPKAVFVFQHRATQSSPSWLPVLEKHDIPIVVGVGVSLAFIFITVSFYSVVQKNGPAPTSRAGTAPRPHLKHAECNDHKNSLKNTPIIPVT